MHQSNVIWPSNFKMWITLIVVGLQISKCVPFLLLLPLKFQNVHHSYCLLPLNFEMCTNLIAFGLQSVHHSHCFWIIANVNAKTYCVLTALVNEWASFSLCSAFNFQNVHQSHCCWPSNFKICTNPLVLECLQV